LANQAVAVCWNIRIARLLDRQPVLILQYSNLDDKMDPSLSQEDHELLLMSPSGKPHWSKTGLIGLRSRLQLRLFTLVGWKSTLLFVFINCVVVFSVNMGFFLWAVARGEVHDGRGVLYEGDCSYVRRLNTGIHVLINILSTGLLAASNYGMVPSTRLILCPEELLTLL
jgi:hypothetical protein